ncbi:MAG: hypothetical protein DSZ28_08515 [Thiothrix sp.]|nr:MAG: hypothetical protein DSZ28_08515 [Thiothrix sp.]
MIEYAQNILTPSGSVLKSLAGVHPVVLGIAVGIGAYYAVDKYLLNKDVDDTDKMAEAEEELDEGAAT